MPEDLMCTATTGLSDRCPLAPTRSRAPPWHDHVGRRLALWPELASLRCAHVRACARLGHPRRPGSHSQMESFKPLAGKAFTTFFAGLAATFTVLPNISLTPAFVAFLCFSFNITSCGITNFSVFTTSVYAMACSSPKTPLTTFAFRPVFSAIVFMISPPVMAFFVAFIAFIAGAIARGWLGKLGELLQHA